MTGSERSWPPRRAKPRKRVLGALTGALVLTGLAACSGGGAAGENSEFSVTMTSNGDFPRLDPQASTAKISFEVHFGNVSEPLVVRSPDGKPVPRLAESWEATNADTWRFHLRQGVKFSNGEPFNAAAAKFSLDRMASAEFASSSKGKLARYQSSTAVDEYTLDVKTKGSAPDWPMTVTLVNMMPPVATGGFSPAGPMETGLAIGTGPYEMVERTADRIVLKKRQGYWGGEVGGPTTVTILARPEVATAVAALQANEVDIVEDVPVDLIGQVEATTQSVNASRWVVQLNSQGPVLDNPALREAVVLGIDGEGIRNSFFGEKYSKPGLCQYVAEGTPGFNPALKNQPFDPARARQLVQQAGATGTRLRLAVPAGYYPSGEAIASVMAEQLNAIGFKVELVVQPFGDWLKTIATPPKDRVELFMITAGTSTGVQEAWDTYAKDGSQFEAMPYDEFPGLSQNLERQAQELDPAKRATLQAQVSEGICQANATRFLMSDTQNVGHTKNIEVPKRNNSYWLWSDVKRTGS